LDEDGNSPLLLAAKLSRINFVKYLISLGSDPLVKNAAGETPLAAAKSNKSQIILDLL